MTVKIYVSVLFATLMFCPAAFLNATQILFISPEGNDTWSGSFAEPLPDGSDGPLATLSQAQKQVREWIADTTRAREPIVVNLRNGQYAVNETLHLDQQDSGMHSAPITWKAFPGETVILNGGRQISGFKQLSDTDISAPVPETYRTNIYVTNLKEQGIEYPAQIERRSRYDITQPGPIELYYKNQSMILARYPNSGWVEIADVPQKQGDPIHEGHHADRRDGTVPTGRHYGSIKYSDNRPASWASTENIWAHGYWTWDWAESTQRIQSLNTETQRITFAPPHHRYGYTTDQRYYYFNIPEELDSPGEWYLDRESGNLYFWPPDESFDGKVYLSSQTDPMIRITNAQHIRIRSLEFAYSRGPAIRISGSEQVSVDSCRFYCLGGRPVTIEEGISCGVENSEFTQLSTGAVFVDAGNRKTLEPAHHQVLNNHIHDFSQVYKTNHPAIRIHGVGHRVAHNLIHNAPHMALYFRGNDHIIEYNEIHDIARETGDVGAIYTGRDYTSRGTVIRYNYLHHLHGPGLHGVRGVYLDDFTSGIEVFGNVFYRAGRAAFIGGGRDNSIQNNLFVECQPSVQIDGRGLSWANHHFDEDHPKYASTLKDKYLAANPSKPPYSVRYPRLQHVYQDDPKVPKNNVVKNNLTFDGIFLDLYDGVDLNLATVRHNLIADPVALRMSQTSDQNPDFTLYRLGESTTENKLEQNILWEFEFRPYLIKNDRIYLDEKALPAAAGFLPIPIHKIGLQPK